MSTLSNVATLMVRFTLPDTDTDTETDTDTDNDKFYTTHFCRSLYRSFCRAV